MSRASRDIDRVRLLTARILRLLEGGPAGIAGDDHQIVITGARGDIVRAPAAVPAALERAGLVQRSPGRLDAMPEAQAWLARYEAAPGEGFAAQHRPHPVERTASGTATVNPAESPVSALARMRSRDGTAWLTTEQVAAADRLRRDFTFAGMTPRMTANWEAMAVVQRRSGQPGTIGGMSDSAIDARTRLSAALDALGPDLAGVALDVCCFLKGLELVERERNWPQRSAKLMLRTALDALDRHYRPPVDAGRTRRDIRHWGSADFRPAVSAR